jgi:hypothetical protein
MACVFAATTEQSITTYTDTLWHRSERTCSKRCVCVCVPVTGPIVAQKVGRGIAYSSKTAALEGGEGSASCPGCTLPRGKTQYPLYTRLGGPQGRSGWAENLALPGFDPRTIQPVVSRYTDWATRPTHIRCTIAKRTTTRYFEIIFLSSTNLK